LLLVSAFSCKESYREKPLSLMLAIVPDWGQGGLAIPQPKEYPGTVPHAVGDATFKLMPPLNRCVLRAPAYPSVSRTSPGSWRSTSRLNCWIRPSLKFRFCDWRLLKGRNWEGSVG